MRFITFFASYVGLPAPKGQYRSTARISDNAMAFIEREMAAAAADPAIRHIVLASHWAIADRDGKDFICPIVDACKENKMNDNRRKLLALCERYGCDLYINGHEHNGAYPVAKVGPLSNINCGTPTCYPPKPGGKGGGAFPQRARSRRPRSGSSRVKFPSRPSARKTSLISRLQGGADFGILSPVFTLKARALSSVG